MGPESDADGRLYTAVLGYLEATERGEPPDLDALAADLGGDPGLAAELREFALAHALVDQLTAPVRRAAQPSRPRRSPRTARMAAASRG